MRLRKATALLIYLALNPRPHSRETLATLLYPGYGQSSALGNLRRTLSSLNKAIGDCWLESDRQTISLRPRKDLWVDVLHFRELIGRHEPHEPSGGTASQDRIDNLRDAVALYQDGFLTGFTLPDCPEFDGWQTNLSEQLRRDMADALERLVRSYLEEDDLARALTFAQRWLAMDTYHEPAQRELMKLYARSGQRSAALHQYEVFRRLSHDELGVSPSPETVALVDEIRRGDSRRHPQQTADQVSKPRPAPAAESYDTTPDSSGDSAKRHNLPAQMTPFVGREEELAELARLLGDPSVRLVTILAPGGMGKTRLAQQVAVAQLPAHRHGVYFVELAPLHNVEGLAETISDAVGYQPRPDGRSPEQQLLDYFTDRQVLLVLDNFEHMLEGSDLVIDLLRTAPMVRVLVTSRERLRLSGETVLALQGLRFPAPESDEDALEYDAVRYFMQCARHTRADFALTVENLPHIAHICRLVQGMPLGILLATSWADLLSFHEIASEIERSLDFLAGEFRDLPERQRSIRAVFASSWQRLSPEERAVFSRLAVFHGGLTRAAAESVTQATLPALSALVSRSLLWRRADGRYEVHELLRQFAEERLQDTGQFDETRDAHAAYYADFLHERVDDLKGRRQLGALDEIDVEWDNVRAAWQWAVERRQVDLVGRSLESLYLFCIMRSRLQAGQDLLRQAREKLAPAGDTDPHAVWGRLMARAMKMNVRYLEPVDDVRARVQIALAIAQAHQDEHEIAFCQWALGMAFLSGDDYAAALNDFERSVQSYRALDDPFYLAWALYHLGLCRVKENLPDDGALQESLKLRRGLGDRIGIAYSLLEIGMMEHMIGRLLSATPYWQESYAIQREMGNRQAMAENLVGLTASALAANDLVLATSLTLEMQEIAGDTNSLRHKAVAEIRLGQIAEIKGDFAESRQRFERARSIVSDRQISCAVELCLCGVAIAEGSFLEAKRHLRRCLLCGIDVHAIGERYDYPLQAAMIVAGEGHLERATSLLAMGFERSPQRAEQLGSRPEVVAFIAELKAALTPEAYAKAWAHGQTLSWEDVVQELISEWVE